MHLERLARTYWKYLSRVTLGLIRVEYTATERAVVLLHRPLVLLRFKAPEYEMGDGRGIVRWTIRDGILVARPGRSGDGYLEIDVRRCPADEPGLREGPRRGRGRELLPRAGDLGGALVLRQHAVAHPRARHARVPALARAARARGVRRRPLRAATRTTRRPRTPGEPPVNVGDTPWLAWAGIAAGMTATSAFLYLRFGYRRRRR